MPLLSKGVVMKIAQISFSIGEQAKSSDIEQQPPFGDCKQSNTIPKMRGKGGGYKTNENILRF